MKKDNHIVKDKTCPKCKGLMIVNNWASWRMECIRCEWHREATEEEIKQFEKEEKEYYKQIKQQNKTGT